MRLILPLGGRFPSISRGGTTPRRFLHASGRVLSVYQPLRDGEIRLIDLYPGRHAETLRCKLRNAFLNDNPSYESLSYCWGLNTPWEYIDCGQGRLPVTKNLFAALQHLRDGQQTRTLWIDAMCINQENLEERGKQVSLMKDIFALSQRTVVWLGEESQGSHRAIELVQHLTKASQEQGTHGPWSTRRSSGTPPLYDPAWRALSLLLQRPWFHRAWVVQEASVPKDILVVCGNESIPWDKLLRAVHHAVDLGVLIAHGGSTTFQALRLFESRSNFQNGHLPSLHQILLRNRSFLATDARDKVFGLLSLADPASIKTLRVQPDYNLSVEQLYKNIAMSLLERNNLSAFSACGVHNQRLEPDWPSWVSDWRAFDPSMPLDSPESLEYRQQSFDTSSQSNNFDASGSTNSCPTFDHQKNLLSLEGLLIDQVEIVGALSRTRYLRHVSHMFELFVQCHDILEQLKDWEQVARTWSRERYLTGEKPRDVYWHTLCAGRVPRDMKSAFHDSRYKYYILIRSLRLFVRLTICWFPRSERDTWYNRLFYSMFEAAWATFGLTPAKIQRIGFPPEGRLSNYRRMIRTKNGYIALAPRHTRAGDWIGVFKGGKMPLVIRKQDEYWKLMGEGYVHGLMNGEAWDVDRCQRMWFK